MFAEEDVTTTARLEEMEQASNMRSDPTAATEAAVHKSDELMSVMN